MITVTLNEKEILSHPNYYDLGELVHHRYLREKEVEKSNADEHFVMEIAEDGRVISIDSFDPCVECGKNSPYRRSTHIDMRIGYVEGAGQGCFQPHTCKK